MRRFFATARCDAAVGETRTDDNHDQETCIQILGECGFPPTGPIGVVNLCEIPNGLNAEETERFLRENGANRCGFRTRDDQQKSQSAVGT